MTDEIAAYHEAGHGIAAVRLGVPLFQQLILLPEDHPHARGGIIRAARPLTREEVDAVFTLEPSSVLDRDEGSLLPFLVMLLAGQAAEYRHLHGRTGRTVGGGADWRHAEMLLAQAFKCQVYARGLRVPRILNHAILPTAGALVKREWRWIERVAAALLERRQLTRADVEALKTEK